MKIWFIWDVERFLLHILVGVLFYIIALIIPPLTLGVVLLFCFYEITEDWHIKDGAHKDIQGAIGGVIIMVILHYLYIKELLPSFVLILTI